MNCLNEHPHKDVGRKSSSIVKKLLPFGHFERCLIFLTLVLLPLLTSLFFLHTMRFNDDFQQSLDTYNVLRQMRNRNRYEIVFFNTHITQNSSMCACDLYDWSSYIYKFNECIIYL